MKTEITFKKEVDIKHLRVHIPVRYDEEDIPKDFPLRVEVPNDKDGYDWWDATIEVDTGKILNWPQGVSGEMNMKVCDEGSYYLLDESGEILKSIEQDYAPNSFIPGEYGDYISLNINEEGIITNWYKHPRLEEFQDND